MSTIKMLSELPTEVIMNIQSYLLGRPEDLKIKRNKNFMNYNGCLKSTIYIV